MDCEVPREERRPLKSREIARACQITKRGRIIMILYKPIVASVVTSLMIAGRRRPTSGASARCSHQRRIQYRHRPS
jgi:hypothetical protein